MRACSCMYLCVCYRLKQKNYSMQKINSLCIYVHEMDEYACMYAYLHVRRAYSCMREMWGAFKQSASRCPLSRQEK